MKKAAAPTKAEINFASRFGATKSLIDTSKTPKKKASRDKYNSGKVKEILHRIESVDSSGSETNNKAFNSTHNQFGTGLSQSVELYRSVDITNQALNKKKPRKLAPLLHDSLNIENVDDYNSQELLGSRESAGRHTQDKQKMADKIFGEGKNHHHVL